MSGALDMLRQDLQQVELAGRAITEIPYAQFIGAVMHIVNDHISFSLPYKQDLIGNIAIMRLHGGAVGGFLELVGALTVARALAHKSTADEPLAMPKPLNLTLDYLRGGRAEILYAEAKILKLGRRFANVRAESWQGMRDNIIASAHINFVVA